MKYAAEEILSTLKKAAEMLTAFQKDQCLVGELLWAYLDENGEVILRRFGEEIEDSEVFDAEDVAIILANDQQEAENIEQERIKEQIADLASTLESDKLDIGRLTMSQTAILKNIEKKQEEIRAKEEQMNALSARLGA